mmetsp:Transcript_14599/g.62579  ORF Transcript_14599/g.62579 Transcript_14599/m.62579 type:complete len:625 (-) Transcript_14599:95-1969(-)
MPAGKHAGSGGAKGAKGPATPALSIGWTLRFFWSSSGKEFVGTVLDYNPQNKHHTVKWENGPDGRTGVTATNLKEGVVTWLTAPGTGMDAHLTPGTMDPSAEGPVAAGESSQKKKKQKLASSAIAASGKKKPLVKPGAKPRSTETLEEVEKRIGAGTIKGICFQVLKDAGPTGLLLSEIVAQTKARGLKDWDSVNQPSNTVNACCSGDPAFVKVAPGRVGLACLGAVESPDLAAQEEREHGEKVLYCDACRGGPFNTKGMRMHISRWCVFAKGNARGDEGVTPKAVTDKVAAAADLAASRRAATQRVAGKKESGPGGKDGGSAKKWVEPSREPRTITCVLCGAGPFNEKGAAMHSSRWCKAVGAGSAAVSERLSGGGGFGSPLDGGFAGLFRGVGGLGLGAGSGGLGATLGFGLGSELSGLGGDAVGGASKPSKKRKADESSGLMLPPSPPSLMRGAGSFSTGMDLAAMFGNLAGVPAAGAGGAAAANGSGFARGLIDYMARTFSGGAFSGGLSGGVLGGGGDRVRATAEQEAPVELKIDVNVYKEDGTFVAKAPLAVTSTVTLGGVKDAVAVNTNGALPPSRQRLKFGGSYLPRDDTLFLRDFVDVKKSRGKISMDLTILHEA